MPSDKKSHIGIIVFWFLVILFVIVGFMLVDSYVSKIVHNGLQSFQNTADSWKKYGIYTMPSRHDILSLYPPQLIVRRDSENEAYVAISNYDNITHCYDLLFLCIKSINNLNCEGNKKGILRIGGEAPFGRYYDDSASTRWRLFSHFEIPPGGTGIYFLSTQAAAHSDTYSAEAVLFERTTDCDAAYGTWSEKYKLPFFYKVS